MALAMEGPLPMSSILSLQWVSRTGRTCAKHSVWTGEMDPDWWCYSFLASSPGGWICHSSPVRTKPFPWICWKERRVKIDHSLHTYAAKRGEPFTTLVCLHSWWYYTFANFQGSFYELRQGSMYLEGGRGASLCLTYYAQLLPSPIKKEPKLVVMQWPDRYSLKNSIC